MIRALLVTTCLLWGCAGTKLQNGVFQKDVTRYRVGDAPPGWREVRFAGNDVAYVANDSPHSLAINATCEDHADPSLQVLTRHLTMGFTENTILSQESETLDGRAALRTHLRARLDGVPVELILVVMKKDGCVYDFSYLSPQGRADEQVSALEHVLHDFKVERAT
jgi:hypothetical protein